MPTPATLPLVDRVIEGGLEAFLRESKDRGLSLRGIVGELEARHEVRVSVETVRSWCQSYGIPTERKKAEG